MPAMMATFGLENLSVEDRLRLVEELWDSIAATPDDLPVTEAQLQDLQRRLSVAQHNPKAGSSWKEVQAKLRSKPT